MPAATGNVKLVQAAPEDRELTVEEIRKAIPAYLFKRDEMRFMVSVLFSLSLTLLTGFLAYKFIPFTAYMIPVWILYAIVCGTISVGLWVLGHECGHGAFSDKQWANDLLGYILHTFYLVPYFNWQYSHHVHHSRTSHIDQGETHVPNKSTSSGGRLYLRLRDAIGEDGFSLYSITISLILGWPAYLTFGVTAGPERGFTSHFFIPNKLFTKKMLPKLVFSNIGIVAVIYGLYLWAQATSFYTVLAMYIGPYLVGNAWLVGLTFLQHTEHDIPHYDASSWNFLKGALCTIDRNYPAFINALHFDIGSTHVLHHVFSTIPHYNAIVANEYFKQVVGKRYRFDERNIFRSLFESSKLAAVEPVGNGEWRFVTKFPYFTKDKKE